MISAKKLRAAQKKGNFAEVLESELLENFESIPLGRMCEEGGMPDRWSIEIYDISEAWVDDEGIHATFGIGINEELNTSCGNSTVSKYRTADFAITVTDKRFADDADAIEIEMLARTYTDEF